MSTNEVILDGLKKRIRSFFEEHYDERVQEISGSPMENSVTVDYKLLQDFDSTVAEDLANSPEQWLTNARSALEDYSDNTDIEKPRVLVKNYESYNPAIKDLRDKHLGKLVRLDGTVSKATGILHKAHVAAFECSKCGSITKIKQPLDSDLEYPTVCSGEDCENRIERDFRINPTLSETINFRKVEIQEPPEETSGGETPETQTFTVKGDIADNITAGDNVTGIGIYRASDQGNTSIFRTYVKGVNIIPEEQEFEELEITDEDKQKIQELAEDDDIYEKLRDSIAPNLYDLESEKEAVLYQLFRGVRKTKMEGTTVRGDIHVLLCGDPGTGKSQLLRYASRLAPRGVMTSGQGASEAGLTAAAVRDSEFGGEDKWTLKAGALVLADQGLACVDEIDKMDSSDRSAMHEGLEQQTISVSKAGINSTLKSRCTLLSAANPKDGRWNEFDPVPAQIDLEPALVSRFDMIFAPVDERTEERDTKLAGHILNTNLRGQQLEAGIEPDEETGDIEPDIPPELFKKYVAYSRQEYDPVMTEDAKEFISEFFVNIRAEGAEEGAIPVTARKIEGVVRVSEAAARIELSDTVEERHAEKARDIIMESLKDVGYDEEAGRFDTDMTETNQSTTQRDRRNVLRQVIEENEDEGDKGAPRDLVLEVMTEEYGFKEDKVDFDLRKLGREGEEIYEPQSGEFATL